MERRKRVARVRTQLVKEKWMYCKTQKIDETERAAEFARSLYYEITGDELRCSTKEVLIVCCVDVAYRPLTVEYVSVGTSDSTIVGIKEVFMTAILSNADGIFVFHNHPSGDPCPSIADGLMTQKIREAGTLLGIPLKDHIVVGDEGYYSYEEKCVCSWREQYEAVS